MAAVKTLPAYSPAAARFAAYSVPAAVLGLGLASQAQLRPRKIIAMATAAVAAYLPAQVATEIGALVGLAELQSQRREEQFAPFCGKWIKDKEASESMIACCQLLGFSSLIQHAIKLIKGLDITMQQGAVCVSVCSFISWFKITERYPVDGSEAKNNRRDMRSGGMSTRLASDGSKAHLRMAWDGSYPGGAVDELFMPNPDELHIITRVWTKDNPTNTREAKQVYRRAVV